MGLSPITKHIVLDISIDKYISVTVNQYDKNIQNIIATITDCGRPYTIDNSTTICVKGKKSDNHNILNYCKVLEDGRIDIKVTPQMTAVDGIGVYELAFFNSASDINDTDKALHTMDFILNVKKGVFQNDEEIISTNEFNALEEALLKINGLDIRRITENEIDALF